MLCVTHTVQASVCPFEEDTATDATDVAAWTTSDLVFVHKSDREREDEPQFRIGEPPTGRGLDRPKAVGNRVPVDPEGRRGFGQARSIEDRAQCCQSFGAHVRST